MLSGLAAVVGPLFGGLLATVADWRGLFLFLAAVGGAVLLAVALQFTETLPADRRTPGGLAQTGRDYRTLLSDRRFVGAVLVSGFAYAAVFAYLAGATYVLQGIYGLTPQQYALAFGLNSAGFMVFGWLAARATERWSAHGTLITGLVMCTLGAVGLLVGGLLAVPVGVVIVSLFMLVGGVAATTPPTTTIALAGYPQMAGTASSLLGMARFAIGGFVAPLVGIAGAATMLPLGIVTGAVVALAAASVALLARNGRDTTHGRARPDRPNPNPLPRSRRPPPNTPPPPRTEGVPTMRGVIMYGPGDVRVEDREKPTIVEPTDAIIRVTSACICGSDLWPYRGAEDAEWPVPMGHEYVGVVEQIGADVRNVAVGDFVVGSFFASDNTCEICRAGYQTHCIHRQPGAATGSQSEYLRVPLADGTLVATPTYPTPEQERGLLAASDVLGTGWFAAVAAEAARARPWRSSATARSVCSASSPRSSSAPSASSRSRATPTARRSRGSSAPPTSSRSAATRAWRR